MTYNLVEGPERPDVAQPFDTMATRIKLNNDDTFGGAMVAIGPGGEMIEMLLLDPKPSSAVFWGTVKTRVDLVLAQLQAADQRRDPWAGR